MKAESESERVWKCVGFRICKKKYRNPTTFWFKLRHIPTVTVRMQCVVFIVAQLFEQW